MRLLKRLSLVPKGLRYKLVLAFCLMSIIPLLVAVYFMRDYVFYVFMSIFSQGQIVLLPDEIIQISWILFFCIVVAYLGLVLAKQMIEPVIEMALEAKLMAQGDFSRSIDVSGEDEISDLARSINQLNRRIKGNMEELKVFGDKTKLINLEIHKRILALSGLLQIGESISASVQMEDVMTLIVDKITQIINGCCAMIFLPKTEGSAVLECNVSNNVENEKLTQLNIELGEGFLGTALAEDKTVCVDANTKLSREMSSFREDYELKDFIASPIISRNRVVGMLLVANETGDIVFQNEDLELIKVFTKQAAIAYESDELAKRAKQSAIKDELTDLYNEKYIAVRLEEEIKRSIFYQRPCSYILFNVDDFSKFREKNGELATEKALMMIASILKESITQVGRAARLSGDEFALLLPEKNKKEAYRIAEEVRKKVEKLELDLEEKTRLTISGGVSENPLDGSTAKELMKKAADSVSLAKSQGKNRIA